MEGPPLRVLLRPLSGADDVDDAALDLGWRLDRHWDASDERPYEDLYVDEQHDDAALTTTISYVDDTYIGARYLVVRGPRAREVADDARALLPTVGFDEAVAVLDAAADATARAAAVPPVALAAVEGEGARATAALREAARRGDDAVRRAIVRAATYTGWPELRTLLVELQEGAEDSDVRRLAAAALEGLRLQDAQEGR
ncbi:HEAT repeat domain-containing protein [Cellulomonas cellasea]|nr:HEAT repeat domain-containing protein [Cellulomonas cellasea]